VQGETFDWSESANLAVLGHEPSRIFCQIQAQGLVSSDETLGMSMDSAEFAPTEQARFAARG